MNNIQRINPKSPTGKSIPAIILLMVLGVGILFAAVSCSRQTTKTKPADVDYYTCSMHPSVKLQDPDGKCPICGMNLVPVMKKPNQTNQSAMEHVGHDHEKMLAESAASAESNVPTEFTVPITRQQQIGVAFSTITNSHLRQTIRTVGTVTYDKQRHWDFVARVDGYIQKLQVSSRGDLVESNQPLLTIYSPDLLTAQQELVDLLRLRDGAIKNNSPPALESAEKLIASARRRLSLWNITSNQIAELEQSRTPKDTLTLYSPFKGVVQDLLVDQGRRVMTGDHLVDMADLSMVWVWAEFYQDELPLLKKDASVVVTSSSYPGETFSGKISVIDPFINETTRTGRVRLEVENSSFKLRPEMYVDIELPIDLGEGLVVPGNAVMPTGLRNLVFVDKGEGRLEPRFIELGKKFGASYAVTSGLKAGDRVVNNANFLIDAEAKLQGAIKSW